MNNSKKKVALLSNIATDLIVAKLCRKYDLYVPDGFDTWVQDVISTSSNFYRESLDAIVLLLDGTEARKWKNSDEGFERLSLWKSAINFVLIVWTPFCFIKYFVNSNFYNNDRC